MSNKKNQREKQFQSIKKDQIIGTFIRFVVISLIVVVSVIVMLGLMASQMLNAKVYEVKNQYEKLAALYEKDQSETTLEFICSMCSDFYILDKDGKILHQYGDHAPIMHEETLYLGLANESYQIYLDKDQTWLRYISDNKHFQPDFIKMFSRLFLGMEADSMIEQVSEAESEEEIEALSVSILYDDSSVGVSVSGEMKGGAEFPLWIVVPMNDGQEVFLGRTGLEVEKEASTMIVGCIVILLALGVILLLIMFVNLIQVALRQWKVIDTFLTDPITKGHNGSWFFMRLGPHLQRWQANKNLAVVAVLFINYRNFCTCHSLEEGEEIIRKINAVIQKALLSKESLAHVTTSNFAMVMHYENEKQLRKRLKGMIEELENIDRSHKFAFHIGVKLLEVQRKPNGKPMKREDLNIEKEYNDACTARATLSESDDSRIAFFDKTLVDERKWVDQVHELRAKAIEQEEFVVFYQPKYDPKTQKLRGAEALIRWNSPELGFVSPGKFIPIFEKDGFITEIDHFMISHVARDQKAWLDQGFTCVPVSVNVSRAHFIESDLAEQIKASVDEAGAPHELIEIELTESAFFDDKNAMIETILRLKNYGFMVSMDDFGSGYSSLNSLKDMPLDVLKLDAEFFRGENGGGRGEIVVSEAIKLAKNLNMHTVAEGVEEKSQVEFLAKQGCDMIQGYYYAHPMDKGDYEGCMRSGISERALKEAREAENAAKEAEAEGETNVEAQPEAENESKTDAEEAMSAEAVQEAESAEAVQEAESAEAVQEAESAEAAQEAESAEAVQEAESAEEAIDELAEAPQNEAPQDEEPQDDGKEQA